jgi:acylphosphatase
MVSKRVDGMKYLAAQRPFGTWYLNFWGENGMRSELYCAVVAAALIAWSNACFSRDDLGFEPQRPWNCGGKPCPGIIAISGTVTGNIKNTGLEAMIQRQAIEYNLAGSATIDNGRTVKFNLQGDEKRVKNAVSAISKRTKKSSNVNVTLSPATVSPDRYTFTLVGWTSVSRDITTPHNLVFSLRSEDTTIKKQEAKAVWLTICEAQVEDKLKCNNYADDDE